MTTTTPKTPSTVVPKKAVKPRAKVATKAAAKPAAKAAPNAPAAKPLKVAAQAPDKASRAKATAKAPTAAVAKGDKPGKPPKPARVKLVRDGFTMPADDFALIAALKARALAAQREVKKSELLRAGLQVLAALDDAALLAALGRLTPVQQGRPKKGR